MNQLQSKSASISNLALFKVAIPGKTTDEPSVWIAPLEKPIMSFKKIFIGILSSVSFPDKSIPTKETNFTSVWSSRTSLISFSECLSLGIT